MKKLLALAFIFALTSAAFGADVFQNNRVREAAIFGPLFSGSTQTGTTGNTPVVASNACTIALPVTNGVNVNLVGGGGCMYTATCNSGPCVGGDAITGWAITAQSTANSFSIDSTLGILKGGSAAGSVTTGSYTVTVTAVNATATSTPVVQTVTTFQPPIVAALTCSIKTPITNNTNVTLQAGGNCQYTATCAGGACSGGNAISGWGVSADTCTGCYQVSGSGALQGSTNAAGVLNRTDTVTVFATNAGGNSPGVGQTVNAISVPAITNQNFNVPFPVVAGTIGTMHASPTPATWAITGISAGGTGATTGDFAITSPGGVLSATGPLTDITQPGTAVLSLTATNATGTSATGTATMTIGVTCPQGTALADGCTGAQLHGTIVDATLADPQKVTVLYIAAGSGYTNGTYTWTSSGGGCSPNATGTITVSGGAIGQTNYTIANEGAGCTGRPTIAVPAGAGAGSGGFIIPTVYQVTPHNASGTAAGANWNVPGVDYPVGYDTTLTLKDPTTAGLPSGASFAGHTVTLAGSGGTLNGYDFSLHSTHLIVAATGWTITNNKWVCQIGTETELDMIHINSGTITTVINYNYFDGSSTHAGGCISGGQNSAIGSSQTGGTTTVEYNYCTRQDSKCLNFQGAGFTTPVAATVIEKYNFWTRFGECRCGSHSEAEYAFAGNINAVYTWTQTFNAMWQPPWSFPTNNTSTESIQADGTTINNADVENNFLLAQSNGLYTGSNNGVNFPAACTPNSLTNLNTCLIGSAPIFCGRNAITGGPGSDNGTYTGTSVMLNNVLDYSGGFGPYNSQHGCGTGGAAGFGAILDINAGTGNTCTNNGSGSTCN